MMSDCCIGVIPTINYNEARAYRSEKEGMLRPNQWADLTVKVYV